MRRSRWPTGGSWPIANGATRAAPPLLLVHGAPGSRLLCPDEDATAVAGVRLLTLDRPGYGGSNARPDPSLLGWADDVQALADRLGLERFAVVGFSAGG